MASAGVSAALLLVLCLSAACQQQLAQARNRFNVHEPLFADEESSSADSHTVTAGSTRQAVPSVPASPIRQTPPKPSSGSPQQRSATSAAVTPVASSSSSLVRSQSRLIPAELPKAASTAKRQISSPINASQQDTPLAQLASSRTGSSASSSSASNSGHWSALRNYYDKLRPVATWDETRVGAKVPPPPFLVDSQQRLFDTDLQQQQKQIYTVEPDIIRYPPVNNLRSPFELPTHKIGVKGSTGSESSGGAYVSQLPIVESSSGSNCRSSQPAYPIRLDSFAQQPISSQDWLLDAFPGLPDKIFFNQQQTRARHQQDTFGSLVDRGIQAELQQEEVNCGPRNLVRNLISDRRQQRAVGFGEYPSHAGLYNGSQTSDSGFICSATLVHARFALTLASCVTNETIARNNLFVRTGDWNINRKQLSEQDKQLLMMVRQVTRVHAFPRYQLGGNQAAEHNLALLEWGQPIDFPSSEYISPACQAQSRSSLRMRSCFAPVRNITLSTYFDADGDGETKVRQSVQMVEVPINLIAYDDAECRKQTQVESFNFQHPNYICSGDARREQWRAKLKQSQYLGSGIYCDEGGMLSLVSMMHPIQTNSTTEHGFLDLSYYRPWMRNVIASQAGFIRYPQ